MDRIGTMTGTRKSSVTDKTGMTIGTRKSSAQNKQGNSGASRKALRLRVRIHASGEEDDSGDLAGGDLGTMFFSLGAQDAGVGGVGRIGIRKGLGVGEEGDMEHC